MAGHAGVNRLQRAEITPARRAGDYQGAPPLAFQMHPSRKMHEPFFEFELSRELVIRMRLEAGWDQCEAEDSEFGSSSDADSDVCPMYSDGSDSDDSSESSGDDDGDESEEAGKENAVAAAQPPETKLARPATRGAARAAERAAERAAKAEETLFREVERCKRQAERMRRTAADKAKLVRPSRCSAAFSLL